MRTASVVILLLLGVSAVMGQWVEYDFDAMGQAGLGGFGYGGLLALSTVQPVVQPVIQPVLQTAVQPVIQPVLQTAVQPVIQPVLQTAAVQQPAQQKKQSVRYAQPIVTYAQPIVQPADMSKPVVQQKSLTAQAIVQPTFQTAPTQSVQAISATAPTIQKGAGTGLAGFSGPYGATGQLGGGLQYGGAQQQQFGGF